MINILTEEEKRKLYGWIRYHFLGFNANLKTEEDLTTIKELPLWDANIDIEKIPNELFKLKTAKKLNLAENNIRKIPEKISNLENLKILILVMNKINKLPKSIFNIKNL